MNQYDTGKLGELLADFYNLTGIKICIYDSSEREMCYYPAELSEFCALVRTVPELKAGCAECDRQAFSICKKTKKQYSYTCHAGLLECVSPVMHEDRIIGYVVLGQIKGGDASKLSDIKKSLPSELGARLDEAYDALDSIDEGRIRSAMHILDACTGYEYLKSIIRSEPESIELTIERYVNQNIRDDLSVAALCRAFKLSHSEIYSVFKRCFDLTPADLVNDRRLSYACKLLSETDKPINKIAKLSGISDYNYFSKKFKRAYGKSPRAYRTEAREKKNT